MKVTIANQFKVLSNYLLFVVLPLIILAVGSGFDVDTIRIASMITIILGVPFLLLHMGHYSANKGMEVLIDEVSVRVVKNNEVNTYNSAQIKNVLISKINPKYKNGKAALFENYFYVRINLNNGKWIYLTSMLDKKIDEKIKVLKGVDFIDDYTFFAFI